MLAVAPAAIVTVTDDHPRRDTGRDGMTRRWRIIILSIAAAVVIGLGVAAVAFAIRSAPAMPPVRITYDRERFDPEVTRLLDEAIRRYEQDPQDLEALTRLAILLKAHDLPAPAAECFERAARLRPEEPRWQYLHARMRQDIGQIDRAVAAYRAVLQQAPDYAPARYYLGLCLLELDRLDEAEQCFQRLLEARGYTWAGAFGLGVVRLRQGRPAEATTLLRRALDGGGEYYAVLYNLGLALRDLGERASAAEYLARARHAPEKPPLDDPWEPDWGAYNRSLSIQFHRAREASLRGEHERATSILQDLVRRHPDVPNTWKELGLAWLRAGRIDRAGEVLREAVQRFPSYAAAWDALARVRFAEHDLHGAEEAVDRAIALDDRVADFYLSRAMLAKVRRDWARAEQALRRAAALDPRLAEVHASLAEVLIAQGRAEEAVEVARTAIRVNPEMPMGHFQYALANAILGHYEEAVRGFEEVLRLDPDDTKALRNLQRAQAALQRERGQDRPGGAATQPSASAGEVR